MSDLALIAGPSVDASATQLPLYLRPIAVLRGLVRFAVLLAVIGRARLQFRAEVVPGFPHEAEARVVWLHRLSTNLARLLGIRAEIVGEIPQSGLIVANHLSYLDIIVLSAFARTAFVSKAEVAQWPVFGPCATNAGTIYVDRQRRGAVAPVAEQMRVLLDEGVPLVLFPEGTSSGGETVLPFKPSLFAVVAELDRPVAACGIDYGLSEGSVADEVCYWGDHTLAPHLLNLLSKPSLTVRLAFGPSRARTGDRKTIARELHAEVLALRATPALPPLAPAP